MIKNFFKLQCSKTGPQINLNGMSACSKYVKEFCKDQHINQEELIKNSQVYIDNTINQQKNAICLTLKNDYKQQSKEYLQKKLNTNEEFSEEELDKHIRSFIDYHNLNSKVSDVVKPDSKISLNEMSVCNEYVKEFCKDQNINQEELIKTSQVYVSNIINQQQKNAIYLTLKNDYKQQSKVYLKKIFNTKEEFSEEELDKHIRSFIDYNNLNSEVSDIVKPASKISLPFEYIAPKFEPHINSELTNSKSTNSQSINFQSTNSQLMNSQSTNSQLMNSQSTNSQLMNSQTGSKNNSQYFQIYNFVDRHKLHKTQNISLFPVLFIIFLLIVDIFIYFE